MEMQIFLDYDRNATMLAVQLIPLLSQNVNIICLDGRGLKPYPLIAKNMAETVIRFPEARGILICGTGIGMSIVANKVPGIYAHCCRTANECAVFRRNNNGNILCLGEQFTSLKEAKELVDVFLSTKFCKEKENRIEMIEELFSYRL